MTKSSQQNGIQHNDTKHGGLDREKDRQRDRDIDILRDGGMDIWGWMVIRKDRVIVDIRRGTVLERDGHMEKWRDR